MRCDNIFCIYEEERHCLLKAIDLDEQGQCRQCLVVEWAEEELQRKKEELRLTLFLKKRQ